jgi:hypothetical protein
MVGSLTYRTDDLTRWGTGQGSDLDAPVIDLNFWTLFDAIRTLEGDQHALSQASTSWLSLAAINCSSIFRTTAFSAR